LPIDIWGVIIDHLTLNEKPQVQYIKLAFISSVSKQLNSICKKHKQQIGIQSIVVQPKKFQRYFALNGYLNSMVYAHESGCQWDRYTCSNAAKNGQLEILKYAWRWLTTSTRCQVGAALLQRMSTALSAPERVHLRLS
jgi:hypothetical protein